MVPQSTRRLPAWISLGVVAGVFGLSGGAALVYQVAWQRILALHSGAGNIYSVEFFRLCSARLKPGAMMCQWGPTQRVRATFCKAFPHVLEVPGKEILVGSNDPIEVDLPRWLERLEGPHVQQYLGGPIAEGLRDCLRLAQAVSREGLAGTSFNRDLFPRDEFVSPD